MQKSTGIAYLLLASLLWSLAGLGAKYIPWHPLAISCVRGTVAAITIGCMRRKWRFKLTRSTVMAALCMFTTTIIFMFANKMTTAANAIVLQYTAPIYVLVAMIVITKYKPRPLDIATIVITFSGILLFFIDHLGHGMLLGDILSLLSGISFAGVFFFNNQPTANPQDSSFLGCALSILLFPALFFDKQVATAGMVPWIATILLGVIQLGTAYYFFSKGIQKTSAITSSIICMTEPILNPIWVFLVMGERPGVLSIIGAAVVVSTICTYSVLNIKRESRDTIQSQNADLT